MEKNGYTLAALLRKTRNRYRLSAASQALFYELVAIANDEGWEDTFKCSNEQLILPLCISEKSLINYRNELIQAGLIIYKSGKSKKVVGDYSLPSIVNFTTNRVANPTANQVANAAAKATTIRSDLNKEKGNNKLNIIHKKSAREKQIAVAIADFTVPNNPPDSEKEKSSAQKENDFPTVQQALFEVAQCSPYQSARRYFGVDDMDDQREEMFGLFWELNETMHKRRLPDWLDVAKHFYNWLPIYLKKLKDNGRNNKKSDPGSPSEWSGFGSI